MEEIIKQCKAGVYLTVNRHKDMYDTTENAVNEINERDYANNGGHADYEPEIDEELKARMIKEDCIYELQFYPHTPIGSYCVYGTSLEEVVEKAKKCLND